MKHKPTGWSKAREGPKRPILGQMRAFWGHWGPQMRSFRAKIVSDGSVSMHSSVFDPFFTKHKPTGWSKAREGLKRILEPNEGLLG